MHAHRNHLWLCAAILAVAVMAVVMTGGAPASIGLLVAALLCPIGMGVVLWLLLRAGRPTGPDDPRASDAPRVGSEVSL